MACALKSVENPGKELTDVLRERRALITGHWLLVIDKSFYYSIKTG